jgi:hypothetical protein
MPDTGIEAKPTVSIPGGSDKAVSSLGNLLRWDKRRTAYDAAIVVLIATLVVMALYTFKDYAISNDEPVQHLYGELILRYYGSGFQES